MNFDTGAKGILASGFVAPTDIALESSGQTALIIDQSNGGTLFRVNLVNGALTPLASGFPSSPLHTVAIESGGATAIVGAGTTTFGGSTAALFRVDLTSGNLTTLLVGAGIPTRVVIEPGGNSLLVGGSLIGGDAGIARTDLSTGMTIIIFGSGLASFCSHTISDFVLTRDASEIVFSWNNATSGQRISRVRLSDKVFSDIAYGFTPQGLALEDDSTVLATAPVCAFHGLYRLDIAAGATESLGGTATAPDFAILPGGQEVVVTTARLFGDPRGDLLHIDLSTGQATNILVIDPAAQGITLEPSGNTILVTSGDQLLRITLATGNMEILVQGLVSPGGLALEAPERAIVGSLSNHVSRVDLINRTVTPLATTIGQARYVAVEPGAQSALVAESNRGLSRIDLVTHHVTELLADPTVSGKVVIEAGGQTALLATGEGIKRVRIK